MIFGSRKKRRRERLRATPAPAEWRAIVERNVGIFRHLPPADQAELLGHVQVFLDEKHFEGAGGLELTDEIRVTVAAQACLLLLHRETDYYPRLTTILVYPTGYVDTSERHVGDGIWTDDPDELLGHTQEDLGALVLSWDDTVRGSSDPHDGMNLVLHEFAHQLDFEDGDTDGTPPLDSRDDYRSWEQVLQRELEALRRAERQGRDTVIDTYGAEGPSEFFAVATEAFFERPVEMRRRHAELYEVLARFFRQDPASLLPEEGLAEDPATERAPDGRRRARPTGPRPRRRG